MRWSHRILVSNLRQENCLSNFLFPLIPRWSLSNLKFISLNDGKTSHDIHSVSTQLEMHFQGFCYVNACFSRFHVLARLFWLHFQNIYLILLRWNLMNSPWIGEAANFILHRFQTNFQKVCAFKAKTTKIKNPTTQAYFHPLQ